MKIFSRPTGKRGMRKGLMAIAMIVALVLTFATMAPVYAQQVDETEAAQKSGSIIKKGTGRAIQMQMRQTGYSTSYGKNKVTYDQFDFWVYKAPHFDIMYYQEEEAHLDEVVAFSEEAYQRLRRLLNHDLSKRTPIVYYQTHAEFEQTHIFPYFLPEGVAAFAEPTRSPIFSNTIFSMVVI